MFTWAPIPAAVPPEPILESRVVKVAAALPAKLLLVVQAKRPLGAELFEDLVREPFGALPLLGVRCQLALHEAADRCPQLLMLVGEGGGDSSRSAVMPEFHVSGYTFLMRRTTLDIDEDMLQRAREALGTTGVKDTVNEALREIAKREAGKRLIAWYKENEDLANPEIMKHARRAMPMTPWPPTS